MTSKQKENGSDAAPKTKKPRKKDPVRVAAGKKGGRPKGSKDSKEAIRDRQNRKIINLRAKNVPVPAIAATVGLSERTVNNRIKDLHTVLESLEKLDEWEHQRGELLSAAGYQVLKSMMQPDKLEKASFNNLAYGLTQIHQAERLERNKSTSNVQVAQFTKVDLDAVK